MTERRTPVLREDGSIDWGTMTISEANLWYPGLSEPYIEGADVIEVRLIDVRAADDIRIHYDFARDGYVISMRDSYECCWREKALVQSGGE